MEEGDPPTMGGAVPCVWALNCINVEGGLSTSEHTRISFFLLLAVDVAVDVT